MNEEKELAIIDKENPSSIYNLAPPNFQKHMESVPNEVWEMSVFELANKTDITLDEKKLRIAFWLEHERALRNNTPINLNHIARGIVNIRSLNSRILADPYKLAYILTPPEDYRVKLEEMLILALEEERKVLELPVIQRRIQITKDGKEIVHEKVDAKLAALKHQIRESLHNRVHGAVAQKQLNVNRNIDDKNKDLSELSEQDLERIVNELRNEEAIEIPKLEDEA